MIQSTMVTITGFANHLAVLSFFKNKYWNESQMIEKHFDLVNMQKLSQNVVVPSKNILPVVHVQQLGLVNNALSLIVETFDKFLKLLWMWPTQNNKCLEWHFNEFLSSLYLNQKLSPKYLAKAKIPLGIFQRVKVFLYIK